MPLIAGVTVQDLSKQEALERIRSLAVGSGRHTVVTANPEIMVEVYRNPAYARVLQGASLVVADGAGIIMASWLTGQPITKGRVTGVWLVQNIAAISAKYGLSIYLLGSTIDVLQKATHNLSLMYGKLNIVGYSAGPIFNNADDVLNHEINLETVNLITQARPDVLLVAFGHPKQEMWINKFIKELPVGVAIGVGGSFDFISGSVPRAPAFIRLIGLEWLYRLAMQPSRVRRIFTAVLVFPLLFIKESIYKLFHVEH